MADKTVIKMDSLEITEMNVVPCTNSRYIQPSRVVFKQNGIQRTWDYIGIHDGVYILVYNTTRKAFVLVKQFRPALYLAINREQNIQNDYFVVEDVQKLDSSIPYSVPCSCGVTYEMCAGIVDKEISLDRVAKEELLEECGYDVPLEEIRRVTSWRSETGHAANKQTLFYTEVTDDMLVAGAGGGNLHEGEQIEIFYLPVSEMRTFMYNEKINKEPTILFALSWWIENVNKQKCKNT